MMNTRYENKTALQMSIIDRLCSLYNDDVQASEHFMRSIPGTGSLREKLQEFFSTAKEINIQNMLAPLLRRAAIKHLKYADSGYARGFRAAYEELIKDGAPVPPFNNYLRGQATNGVWGTEVEGGALADMFDVTFVVTPINVVASELVEQTSLVARQSADPARPAIRLYCTNNTHWHLYPGQPAETSGNGNCLYNGFAQALRHMYVYDNKKVHSVALVHEDHNIYADQDAIWAKIKNTQPTPMRELLLRVNAVILREEINDHEYAKSIAAQQKNSVELIGKDNVTTLAEQTFLDRLKIINDKAAELQSKATTNPSYQQSAAAAKTLADTLNTAASCYFQNKNISTYDVFNADCTTAINNARGELEKHRGWKELLGNAALAILGVGVVYLAAACINWKLSGRFFFFQTDSAKKLNQIEEALPLVRPTAGA